MTFMRNWLKQQRRAWAVHWTIYHGERIRRYTAARNGIDAYEWPEDADEFDKLIDYHQRAVDHHLDFLRRTADDV